MSVSLYEQDFYAWTHQQARELRRLKSLCLNSSLDLDRLAREIGDLAASSSSRDRRRPAGLGQAARRVDDAHKARRGDRADAGNGGQPPADRVGSGLADDQPVEAGLLVLDAAPGCEEGSDRGPHGGSALEPGLDAGREPPGCGARQHQTQGLEETADLVEQVTPDANQPLTGDRQRALLDALLAF